MENNVVEKLIDCWLNDLDYSQTARICEIAGVNLSEEEIEMFMMLIDFAEPKLRYMGWI